MSNILEPGYSLTLRPMRYPQLYSMYKDAIKNTWTAEEISFQRDLPQLKTMSESERFMVNRLVAFFATSDQIVSNNLVINLYQAINSPEARMFLSRQLYEEASHIENYSLLLDSYVPDHKERLAAFQALDNIPSIAKKADWMLRHIGSGWDTPQDKLKNIIAFSSCVEGLFFFGAFAYVYFLRQKGLLMGLADMTNYIFKDESLHMEFAFEIVDIVRRETPELFTPELEVAVLEMVTEAVDLESEFAKDALQGGVVGLTPKDMRQYLEYVADIRLQRLGIPKFYNSKNPFPFMEHQGMQSLENFFERRVSSYQVGVSGEVKFDEEF